MSEALWARVGEALGLAKEEMDRRPVGGGCIHEAWRVSAPDGRCWFVKTNRSGGRGMLEAEAEALERLAATRTIRVPGVMAWGESEDGCFLVLEHLAMSGRGDVERQGRDLAALHRCRSEDGRFGWERDNFIGETPQPNGWMEEWGEFFSTRRLGNQLGLARERGRRFRGAEELVDLAADWLQRHRPEPSLLHGDLWGGNAAFDEAGVPVYFDPASYYGDREVDLAFTRMFGGFGPGFYRAYEKDWPLPPGAAEREEIYNLYHVLNHDHLFGGGYGVQAERMIEGLVGRLRVAKGRGW